MFLPIGDAPNPPGFKAWVTWLLLAANVAVYLWLTLPLSFSPVDLSDPRVHAYYDAVSGRLPAEVGLVEFASMISAWDLFVFDNGYRSADPSLATLFGSMFLHGGLLHLAGNMLFLWIYGDNVEHRLGRLGYLIAYLGTGVLATLTFAWMTGPSMVPMVGASGAISGLLGLYFYMFPRNVVRVFVFLFPLWMTTWLVPARIVLGLYVVIDNLLPMLFGAGGGVAYGAHIGGFVGGLALAWVGERLDWRGPWVDRLQDGAAEATLQALIRRDPAQVPLDELLQGARQIERAGHPIASYRLLRTALSKARGARRAHLQLALGELLIRLREAPTAYQYLVGALEHPETRAHARARLIEMNADPRMGFH